MQKIVKPTLIGLPIFLSVLGVVWVLAVSGLGIWAFMGIVILIVSWVIGDAILAVKGYKQQARDTAKFLRSTERS